MSKTNLPPQLSHIDLTEVEQLLLTNAAVNAAANGIAITDLDGRFIWVNPAFSSITGYSFDEAIGKKPSILKSGMEDEAFYTDMWKTITSGKVWSGEIINRRKDGTLYYEEQIITPVRNNKGEISNYIGIKQDVSTRVEAQKALQRQNQELIELNKAISVITSSLDLSEVEHNIVNTVRHIIPQAIGATLQLIDEDGKIFTKTASDSLSKNQEIQFKPGLGAAGIAIQEKRLVNIGNVFSDPQFLTGANGTPFRSLVCIPIIYKDRVFGALSVEGDQFDAFGRQEERFLKLLADYAAAAIQNSQYSEHLEEMIEQRTQELKLAQQQIYAQEQLEQEIKMAVAVQESLLPHHLPEVPGYAIAAVALPAHSVSGDFYDIFQLENNATNIVLADIAGKGIPAAMLTSTARILTRISAEFNKSPALTLEDVNARLYDDLTHAGMFITMLYAQIRPDTHSFSYANAGHTEAILWRNATKTCQSIPVTGIPLGILADARLGEQEIEFQPNDVLVFYSDGITEAMNPDEQFFGVDRLKAVVENYGTLTPDELIKTIISQVDDFCAGRPQSDDITLLIVKALPPCCAATFPADLNQLDNICRFIRSEAEPFGSTFAYQVELACSEIITNIITHAYENKSGDIRVELAAFGHRLQVDLYDQGVSFDPGAIPEVDLGQPHESGYGLLLAKQLMDLVEYLPDPSDGNHWRLVKSIMEEKS